MWKLSAGGRTGRECLECCATKNEQEYQGEVYRTAVRPALVYGDRDMDIEEGIG